MAKEVLNNINVNLNEVPTERCECGSNLFKVVYLIKKISALVSPTGKATIIPIQVFACDKCSKISPLFKNLNDTEEILSSSGESMSDAISNDVPKEKKSNTGLFME